MTFNGNSAHEVRLSRHQAVLHLMAVEPGSESVEFSNIDEADDDYERFEMTRTNWEDFGRPVAITVSIVPGDQLNNEERSNAR